MFVKKFEAPTLEKALAQVKQALGKDALVLSSETVRKRWWSKPTVLITAASKSEDPKSTAHYDPALLSRVFGHRKHSADVTSTAPSTEVRSQTPLTPRQSTVRHTEPKGRGCEQRFLDCGFSTHSSQEYARVMMSEYSASDRLDRSIADRLSTQLVGAKLRTLGLDVFTARRCWTLVGTPGVGKTSLAVKLAQLHVAKQTPVCLISTDTRKLIGPRELAGYAKLLGVQFASHGEDKPSGVLTFIDTPGLVWTDERLLQQTEDVCRDASTLLVLDASSRLEELNRTVELAQRFAPVALAFTRLDQVSRAGVIHDVIRSAKLPLLGCSVAANLRSSFRFFGTNELASYLIDFPNHRAVRRKEAKS